MKASTKNSRRQLAHDLRDPAAAIVTFASLLRSLKIGTLNAKQHGFVDDILASARELLGTIDRGLGDGSADGESGGDRQAKKGGSLHRPSRLRH